MAYQKALVLLQLAFDIAARHYGMSYAEIDEAYSEAPSETARRRNTQRLVEKLGDLLGDQLIVEIDGDGRKRARIRMDRLRDLAGVRAEELSALDRAIATMAANGGPMDAENLTSLAAKIRMAMPAKGRTKLELDTEALISSGHVIPRHGPSPDVDPDVWSPVTEALMGGSRLSFLYPGKAERRLVHPYGVITGYRAYLVARIDGTARENPSRWRIDRMSDVRIEPGHLDKPQDFDLATFAKKGFGAFYNAEEYGEVEWRFKAKVADAVLSYRFHPDQETTVNEDGSVTVRFMASGILEMAWALYPWGDKVEVVKPEALARLVAGHQRADFIAVP